MKPRKPGRIRNFIFPTREKLVQLSYIHRVYKSQLQTS